MSDRLSTGGVGHEGFLAVSTGSIPRRPGGAKPRFDAQRRLAEWGKTRFVVQGCQVPGGEPSHKYP